MPSSASSSLLLELQAAGENLNTWGDGRLNTALSMIEAGGHGITSHTLTANKTLTYTNFTATDGTDFVQKFASGSDGSYVFTLGGYERTYLIWNASSHDQTVDCSGGGTSVTVKAGEVVLVFCDAVNVARLNNKTVTGDLAVSGNVSTVAPTTDLHAATKKYVDDENTAQNAAITASEAAAAASAAAAATSETNAATSEANAAASYDSFDDRYLGAKASDPSVDNDGDALITGAIYWNTGSAIFKVWNGSAWVSLPSGTMAAQNADNVAITGGTITGITDLAVADGGTGASTAAGARTNLGLVIGTNVQAWDADLDVYAANPLTAAELTQLQNIGTSTISAAQWGYVGAISAYGATLIDDADAATARTTLGLGSIATQAASAVAITGGTIDGTAIGGTTPAAGAFTTLSVSGVVAFDTDTLYVNPASDRVGINTPSPIVELQVVNASSNAAISIRSNDASSSILALGDTTNYLAGRIEYDNSSNAMAFFTGSAERVRIDSSGNVGIGTSSPLEALDVEGNGRINGNLTIRGGARSILQASDSFSLSLLGGTLNTTGASIVVNGNGSSQAGNMFLNTGGAVSSGNHIFRHNNGTSFTELMRLTTDGNLGIGTTSPSVALHVVGQINASSDVTVLGQIIGINGGQGSAANNPTFTFAGQQAKTGMFLAGDNQLAFATNSTERVRINSIGNVGIGTTSPATLLHVEEASGSAIAQIVSSDSGDSTLRMGDVTSASVGRIAYLNSLNAFQFVTANSERVRIDSSGNVGIGTTSPTELLHVNGNARVDGKFMHDEGAKLTISSGAITVTHSFHEVETEGGAGTDTLSTINGGEDGMVLYLRAERGVEQTITIDNAGNIEGTGGSFSGADVAHLIYDATASAWLVVSIR